MNDQAILDAINSMSEGTEQIVLMVGGLAAIGAGVAMYRMFKYYFIVGDDGMSGFDRDYERDN